MEIVRYIIVFFVVGWGQGIIGSILSLLFIPILSPLRGTNAGRAVNAVSNGIATLLAVWLASIACDWTGGQAKYLMFTFALLMMVSNDMGRISRAKVSVSMGGEDLTENPELREGWVLTEQMSTVADLIGFGVGLALIPRLAFI